MTGRRTAAFVSIAMLLGASRVVAQAWTSGVNVGVGQGGFTGSQEFVWTHASPNVSAFVSHPLGRFFWFQPEIGFTRKVGVSTTPISRLTLVANYLEFPVLLQYRWPSARFSPFVHLGPDVTVRLSCRLEFEGGGVQTRDDCDVVRGDASQRVDATLMGGVGLAWMVGATRLTIEGRANAGLVSDAAPVDATRPRSFGFSVLFGASRPLRLRVPQAGLPGPQPGPGLPGPLLPPLAAIDITVPDTTQIAIPTPRTGDALSTLGATRLVSVHAVDADVRTLLVAVAQEAGLNLVVDRDVRARVTVSLDNVPAAEAIRAIIQSAGLSISAPGAARAVASAVFYQLPVNINTASAATIQARFGTSAEMANFIVESRNEKPKTP
jgi:hypothetical protein